MEYIDVEKSEREINRRFKEIVEAERNIYGGDDEMLIKAGDKGEVV